ncbi:type II toxin-antitoxin system PrlF family antitoxin [Paracoccus sulfuroxidans]|uniref:AbrB family looped-hinge helix DNA binding protein n=1 Tax=Paracoccus sulfuroxidans TaxID=384678 RepID=A0A562N6Z4_9RHOB|nr:type II toxin-antitoxin system PrlF family antitoxin [Paracoccus sulfuroxidans]TWI27962.1 AbrB family looped-hinge helix DNA binding protein [Paracoccus sulfuroxidans]
MPESTITAKGQTTLPRAVRQALQLGPGDRLRYVVMEDGQVRLMRVRPVSELAGMLRRDGRPPLSIEALKRDPGR